MYGLISSASSWVKDPKFPIAANIFIFYSLLAEFYFGSSIVVLKSSISQNPELNRKEKTFSLEEARGLFAIKMSKGRN
jgi:hypothetical protein